MSDANSDPKTAISRESTPANTNGGLKRDYSILEDDKFNVFVDIDTRRISLNEQSPTKKAPAKHIIDLEDIEMGAKVSRQTHERDDSSLSMSGVYSLGNDSNDYYVNRLQEELREVRVRVGEQVSPNNKLTFDATNPNMYSDVDSIDNKSNIESVSDIDDNATMLTDRVKPKYRKLTYDDVEKSLNKYQSKEENSISEVELLLTYLRGQKHVFKQSHRVTIQKYNLLMFPAMSITAGITVLAPFFEDVAWSGWAISILNALLTVMIAMNNFMKWQAIAELYMNISNQYENLMVSVEMNRNQFGFIEDEALRNNYILDKMKETERRIMDIKLNYNNVLVPYEVQLHNPIISHINIFSFLRKIEDYKRGLILKYKDVKNEISYILYKWERENQEMYELEQEDIRPSFMAKHKKEKDVRRLEFLLNRKEEIKTELMHNTTTNVYAYIDNLFTREIQISEEYYTYHSVGMYILFPPKEYKQLEYGNPVVDQYLNFVFAKNPGKETKEPGQCFCCFR